MRIGIDARPLLTGCKDGISVYLHNVLKHIPKDLPSSYKIYLYAPRPLSLPQELLNSTNRLILKHTHSPLPGTIWYLYKLPELLKNDKIDIMWGTLGVLPILFRYISSRMKQVVTIHDLVFKKYPETLEWKNLWINRFFVPPSIKCADKIITISQNTAKDITNYYPDISSEKVHVIYPGVEKEFYPRNHQQTIEYLSNKLQINLPYILTVGTLEPRKNFLMTFRIFDRLVQQGYAGNLIFAGKIGWKSAKHLRKIKKSKSSNRVIFLNTLNYCDLPFLYSGADVFLFPSLYEGFGLPPLEAMACGAPTIISDNSSLPEVGGDAAICLPLNYFEKWVEKTKEVITNQRYRRLLSIRGQEQAKKFCWEKCSREIFKLLQ